MSLTTFPRLDEIRASAARHPCCQAQDIAAQFGMHLRTAQSYARKIRDEWRSNQNPEAEHG